MSDEQHDYNKEIEELKNIVMYLDDNKNIHDLLSLKDEISRQMSVLIELKLKMDYESKQEKVDNLTEGLYKSAWECAGNSMYK